MHTISQLERACAFGLQQLQSHQTLCSPRAYLPGHKDCSLDPLKSLVLNQQPDGGIRSHELHFTDEDAKAQRG